MKHTLALLAALAISATAMGAHAATPCRDAKGKFMKCATTATATAAKPTMAAKAPTTAKATAAPATTASAAPAATVRCRNATGFAKCGTPGAHPVDASAKSKPAMAAKKG